MSKSKSPDKPVSARLEKPLSVSRKDLDDMIDKAFGAFDESQDEDAVDFDDKHIRMLHDARKAAKAHKKDKSDK